MPQIPFALKFDCEGLNDLFMAELPFSYLEIFAPFLMKMAELQFAIKNIYIFECEWPNGNSNVQLNCVSAIHTQTQTETEGYRIHIHKIYNSSCNKRAHSLIAKMQLIEKSSNALNTLTLRFFFLFFSFFFFFFFFFCNLL